MEIKLKVKEYLIKLGFEPYRFEYSDSRNAIAIGLYVHNSKNVFAFLIRMPILSSYEIKYHLSDLETE